MTTRSHRDSAAQWAAEYAGGDTVYVIAERAGVDPTTVGNSLRAAGVTMRRGGPPGRPEITVDVARAAWRIASTMDGAAKLLGCSRGLVRHRLAQVGLATSPDTRPRTGRTHARTDITPALVAAVYNAHGSITQTAVALGCSEGAVRRRLAQEHQEDS